MFPGGKKTNSLVQTMRTKLKNECLKEQSFLQEFTSALFILCILLSLNLEQAVSSFLNLRGGKTNIEPETQLILPQRHITHRSVHMK